MEAALYYDCSKRRRLTIIDSGKVIGIIREQDLFFEIERILRADQNRHFQIFLQCEMKATACRVRFAATVREVLKRAFQSEPLDLIVLDPHLPDAESKNG